MTKVGILHSLHNHKLEDLYCTGIYTITSKCNGRIYVGSAGATGRKGRSGFYHRWDRHVNSLINNKHYNKHLQAHVNKHGINDLVFEILDFYDINYLASAEHYWIHALDSVKSGFNQTYAFGGLSGENNYGFKTVDIDLVVEMYLDKNIKMRQILDKFKISDGKLYDLLAIRGINSCKRVLVNYDTIYHEYITSDLSMSQLSRKYGYSVTTLAKGFKQRNLVLKHDTRVEKALLDTDLIYKRYLDGEKLPDIAKSYGISVTPLQDEFRRLKYPLRRKNKSIEPKINDLYQQYITNKTIDTIAKENNISATYLQRLFHKHNLKFLGQSRIIKKIKNA